MTDARSRAGAARLRDRALAASPIDALRDLDALASPAAWAGLEEYLRSGPAGRAWLRSWRLSRWRRRPWPSRASPRRRRLPEVRERGCCGCARATCQLETVLDFYGDALASRTNPRMAAILRGLDMIAADSMERGPAAARARVAAGARLLRQGPGASILRAGVRLWDRTNLSPVAAIKLTRHNACHPTALFHETGHQVGHLTGWNGELARRSARTLWRPGPLSSRRCGRAGPTRWPPTSTRSRWPGGPRCPPWRTSWTARPRRSTG